MASGKKHLPGKAALRFSAKDSAFFNWLAGFLDGEGCFYARDVNKNGYNYVEATLKLTLRRDDAAILQHIQQRVGGKITYFAPNNSASLRISSKHEVFYLMRVLDKHPLRAKKRRDYSIWRSLALSRLLGIHASFMTEDLRQLREIKRFNG